MIKKTVCFYSTGKDSQTFVRFDDNEEPIGIMCGGDNYDSEKKECSERTNKKSPSCIYSSWESFK